MSETLNNSVLQKYSRKKATIWDLVFSYVAMLYTIISGFLLVPMYLRFIPVELYGAWLATGNVVNWLLIMDPGVLPVIIQRVGQSAGANDLKAIGEYAATSIFITVLIVLCVFLTGYICSLSVAKWVSLTDEVLASELQQNFLIAVMASSIMLFAYSVGAVNHGLLGSFANGVSLLVANATSLMITVILLFKGAGLFSISIGMVVRAMIILGGGLVYLLWRCRRDFIVFALSKSRIKEVCGLLSVFSLGRIGSILSKNMDAFLLARFVGPEWVSVFVLTGRGLRLAEMILMRMGNAIRPSLSHLLGAKDQSKVRSIVVRLMSLILWMLGIVLGGFLALNDDFVRIWVGQEFFAGKLVSNLLCVLLAFVISITLMQTFCLALGDIKWNSLVSFIQALVTVICLFVGVNKFGMLGAALAPLLGFIIVPVWYYYPRSLGRLASLLKADWMLLVRESVIVFILGAFAFSFSSFVVISSWLGLISYALGVALAYAFLLIAISRLARSEVFAFFFWVRSQINSYLKR